MKQLQSALFFLFCLGIGIGMVLGIGKAIRHYRSSGTESTVDVASAAAPPLRGFYFPADAPPAALDSSPALHATAAAIVYPGSAQALGAAVNRAHGHGAKVALLPPATFAGVDPFPQGLLAAAGEAEAAKVDILCISWLDHDPDPAKFTSEIAQVRKHFTGKLMLAATPEIVPGIEFFDKVDLIGAIVNVLPLPRDKASYDVHDFRTAWACYLDSFESISNRYGKPTVVLDTGAPGKNQSEREEGLVLETKGRPGIGGVFLRYAPGADAGLLEHLGTLWTTASPAETREAGETDDGADADQ
ncbi:MAG: hypothetical protein ACTHN5_23150 [Phycisphaerae bacterium]